MYLEKNRKEKIERKRGNKKEKENKKIEVSGCQPGCCSVRPPPTNQMKPLSSHGATPANHILIFFRYSTDADHIFWFWNNDILNLTLLVLIV